MNKIWALLIVAILGFVCALPTRGEDPSEESLEPALMGIDVDAELPTALQDAAFDRYVDLRLLGEAIHELNAMRLADIALQLAEGERVLLRSHKAIAAKDVLEFALSAAVETRDKTTLQRLADYAKRSGDSAFAQEINQALSLASTARAPGVTIQADGKTTAKQFQLVQQLAKNIDSARLLGNVETLTAVANFLKTATDVQIPSAQRKALIGRLSAAQKTVAQARPGRPGMARLITLIAQLPVRGSVVPCFNPRTGISPCDRPKE